MEGTKLHEMYNIIFAEGHRQVREFEPLVLARPKLVPGLEKR